MPPEFNHKSLNWTLHLPAAIQKLDFIGRFWFAVASGLGAGAGFGITYWLITDDAKTGAEWGRYIALYITGVGALLIAAIRVDWTRKQDARLQSEKAWEFAAKTYIEWKIHVSDFSSIVTDLEDLLFEHLNRDLSTRAEDYALNSTGFERKVDELSLSLSATYKKARVHYEILHLSVLPISEPLYLIAVDINNRLHDVRKMQKSLCERLTSISNDVRNQHGWTPNMLLVHVRDINSQMLRYEQHHVTLRSKALSF